MDFLIEEVSRCECVYRNVGAYEPEGKKETRPAICIKLESPKNEHLSAFFKKSPYSLLLLSV